MTRMSSVPIVVAALAAFVFSFVWYSAFGQEMAKLHPAYADAAAAARPPAWKILVEIVRNLILAFVLARFVVLLGISRLTGAIVLALWLWVGFPVVLWTGAILWENVPPKLAAIHAGDWLAKLILIAAVVGVWRR
jgi:hypothetical protein